METGDTGPVTTPTSPTPTDTGTDTGTLPACLECGGAAELKGDEGGSPCQGCASGGQAGVLLFFVPALLLGRLRRR